MSTGYYYYAIYAGSKAPIEHFTHALAKELMDRGIAVNTIAPGALDLVLLIRPKPHFAPGETGNSTRGATSCTLQ